MKKIITILLVALGAAGVSTISSCKKDINGIKQITQTTDDAKIATLRQLGYNTSNIIDKGSYFVVEGDIMISKKSELFTKPLPTTKPAVMPNFQNHTDQAAASYLVSQSSISIYIDPSIPSDGSNDDWHAAIADAVSYWNAIPNSRIQFNITTSTTADIVIESDSGAIADDAVFAASMFPSTSNAPGNLIEINLDNNGGTTTTELQKAYVMTHELGHTLGFRHTDWNVYGEPSSGAYYVGYNYGYVYGANLINGTRNGADPSSVMNKYDNYFSFSSFSAFDILAVRTIYPLDASQVPLYRYGGTSSARHFYTTSWSELGLGGAGFNYEGPCGYMYNYQATYTTAYYRFYNPSNGDHLYQFGSTPPGGYYSEGIIGYAYNGYYVLGTTPLYRFYKGSAGHFYSLSYSEGVNAGFTYEGVSCYVIQ